MEIARQWMKEPDLQGCTCANQDGRTAHLHHYSSVLFSWGIVYSVAYFTFFGPQLGSSVLITPELWMGVIHIITALVGLQTAKRKTSSLFVINMHLAIMSAVYAGYMIPLVIRVFLQLSAGNFSCAGILFILMASTSVIITWKYCAVSFSMPQWNTQWPFLRKDSLKASFPSAAKSSECAPVKKENDNISILVT